MLPEITTMPLTFLRPLWLLGLIAVALFSLLRYKNNKIAQQQPLIAAHLSANIVSKVGNQTNNRPRLLYWRRSPVSHSRDRHGAILICLFMS